MLAVAFKNMLLDREGEANQIQCIRACIASG